MFGIPTPESLAAKALCALVGAMILVGGGAYAGYRFELGRYEHLVAANAIAQTKAVELARQQERKIAAGNQMDAVAQAYFKGKMDAQTINLVLGVPANVTISQDNSAAVAVSAGCVTYGFYRVLIAGERSEPAESFSIPSGESVDSCTAVKPSDLAAAVAQDLAAGAGNGHQLDSLIAAVKRNDAILMVGNVPRRAAGLILREQGGVQGLPGSQDFGESANSKLPLECVITQMPQPNHIDNSDGQARPISIRQMQGGIKPEVIDAPAGKVGGGQPVNASDCPALSDGLDILEAQDGGTALPHGLRDIGVNVHVEILPSSSITPERNVITESETYKLLLKLPL